MVNEKIKKSTSLWDVVVIICLASVVFIGLFQYLAYNALQSNQNVDSKFNESYTRLYENQAQIDADSKEIEAVARNVTEADSGFFSLNGLKGMLKSFLLFFKFIDSTKVTAEAVVEVEVIPPWMKAIIYTGISLMVILLIVAVFKGDQQKIIS
jgi:hypothetical protein